MNILWVGGVTKIENSEISTKEDTKSTTLLNKSNLVEI